MDQARLEKLRAAGRADLLALDSKTLRDGGMAALEVAEAANDARHRIMVECGGRSPTRAQQEDLNKALEIRTEYGALAERLHRVQEANNDKVRDAAQHDIESGNAQFSDPNAQLSGDGQVLGGDGVDYSKVVSAGSSNRAAGYENQARAGQEFTYRPDDPARSWIKDLRSVAEGGTTAARERLDRNSREWASRENRALTSYTTGAASELVPPAWAMDLIATVARPARVFADQINSAALPAGTMTLNIPRVVTGTSVAAQGTENTTVSDTNIATDQISSAVHTLAGKQTVSFQLVDQSPISIERLIVEDLGAELARQVNLFALTSNAAGKYGILNQAGTSAVAYTDTTPTVGELYSKVADGIQRIATSRFLPADKIFMHPRRWAWFLAALDPQGRPLVVPTANSPMNTLANQNGVVAQGPAGTLQGLPVFLDAVLPTNMGAGTNQDPIVITRSNELLLWESGPRIVADRISLAGQLTLQIVLWEYAMIQMGRYPAATSVVNGTGLVAPTF